LHLKAYGGLGAVYLLRLFLQLFVRYLYKVEPLQCGCSAEKGDINVKCPTKAIQRIWLKVFYSLLSNTCLEWVGYIILAAIIMLLCRTKFNQKRAAVPMLMKIGNGYY
jgi:hypothetical protein